MIRLNTMKKDNDCLRMLNLNNSNGSLYGLMGFHDDYGNFHLNDIYYYCFRSCCSNNDYDCEMMRMGFLFLVLSRIKMMMSSIWMMMDLKWNCLYNGNDWNDVCDDGKMLMIEVMEILNVCFYGKEVFVRYRFLRLANYYIWMLMFLEVVYMKEMILCF